MNTRIRYFQTNEPQVIQSVKVYAHENNGARYKVRINQTTLEYTVIEDTSDTVAANGRATNLHQVKIKAKKALEELGIQFGKEETRSRKAKEQTLSV